MDEIYTLAELVRAVSEVKTAGYEVSFDIMPNLEKARSGDGFFLIVKVMFESGWIEGISNRLNGEWWFDAADQVMQVL